MDEFWKTIAYVLIAVILGITVGKTEKDLSLLLSMTVCSITATVAITYLKPVFDLLSELNTLGKLQDGALKTILKAVGIAMVAEVAAMVCTDAGNGSMAKVLQLLGCCAIAFLSIPMIQSVLILIQDILFRL